MLLLADGDLVTPELAERLAEVVPTVEIASSASRHNLREWDCIIQRGTTAFVNSEPSEDWTHDPKTIYEWGYYYPSGVCVLTLVPTLEYASYSDDFFLGVSPANGKGEELPKVAVMGQNGTVGSHLALPSDLDPGLQRLVHRELIPAMEQRSFHRTVMRGVAEGVISTALRLRPFLLGPDDEVLAGSFDRDDSTPIWFVPSDVPDLFPWAVAALTEWHARFPKRFPAVRDWGRASEWQTTEEVTLTAALAQNEAWVEEQYREFERQEKSLTAKLQSATEQASTYERALLTSDGDDLVDAVACALAELGFHVIDMDEHWPEGQRKEDVRVLDDDAPGSIALVEVKGFTSGVKETGSPRWCAGVSSTSRRQVSSQAPPGMWPTASVATIPRLARSHTPAATTPWMSSKKPAAW